MSESRKENREMPSRQRRRLSHKGVVITEIENLFEPGQSQRERKTK